MSEKRSEKHLNGSIRPASLATSKPEADLQNAVALHQRGHLIEAEKSYRNFLEITPDHFDALHMLGILKHQQGQNEEALELIGAALRKLPSDAQAHSNYGAVLSELKRFDEALISYNKAIVLQSTYARAFYNRGSALQQLRRFDEALASYEKAIALNPDNAEAFNNRGIVLSKVSHFDEALANYDKAIALKPTYAEAFNNRGNVLKELDRFDEALASYNTAIALKPNYAAAFNNRGNILKALKRYGEALANFEKAIVLEPNFAQAFNNRGNAFQELKRFDEALADYDKAIAQEPHSAEAFNNRGNALREFNRFNEALASYNKAIALKPDYAEAFNNRAIALIEVGRLAEARRSAERAIQLAPRKVRYYYTFGNINQYVPGDPRIATMEALGQAAAHLSVEDRIELHFALAKAYEDLGKLERSFGQLLDGNALKRRQIRYDESETLGVLNQASSVFTSEFIRSRSNAGNPSLLPVFIIGMPRSGSTLVEQILASHPEVFGAGELKHFRGAVDIQTKLNRLATYPVPMSAMTDEDFTQLGTRYLAEIKRLAPSVTRVTDKMTSNFILAAFIHLALPNASIIHTIRDPIDTCISCFSKLFGEGELSYTYDLTELGRYYHHYKALMAHWHCVLPPGRILDVRYEDVLLDLEGQARRIIAHCGLNWDPTCLAFHRTERPVRTISATQVRQPIYHSSVGRWRNYEQYLAPLLDELMTAPSVKTPLDRK